MRLATCKICKGKFQRRSIAHVACSTECAVEHVKNLQTKRLEQKARDIRKELRERKEKLKTRSDWLKEAQTAANAYVRARDADMPCISCGRSSTSDPLTGGAWDCGHYRSTGSAPHLRFDVERNMAKQCVRCNRHLSGNVVEYRRGLVIRIGLAEVEALEADQTSVKWSIEDLKEIKEAFKAKLKDLSK